MVRAFVVSSVVKGYHQGYHEYKDVWNAAMTEHNFLVKENRVI